MLKYLVVGSRILLLEHKYPPPLFLIQIFFVIMLILGQIRLSQVRLVPACRVRIRPHRVRAPRRGQKKERSYCENTKNQLLRFLPCCIDFKLSTRLEQIKNQKVCISILNILIILHQIIALLSRFLKKVVVFHFAQIRQYGF